MRGHPRRLRQRDDYVPVPIWQELLAGVEALYLHASPLYWGYGIPQGDGSAVIVVPGFLGTDRYLAQFRDWLGRIGYKPCVSGIMVNAECPNLLIRQSLRVAIERAYKSSGRKVHLIGHSLGGTIARATVAQMPDYVESVITMGSPIRSLAAHPSIMQTAALVRRQILERHGEGVMPDCYTDGCTCDFLCSLRLELPQRVRQTAIYAKTDGIVDWRTCRTGDPDVDCLVSATHIGMVFSPLVYSVVARRLAGMTAEP